MSYVDYDQGQPALGAARVGAELREARLRLGWDLPDVAASLRIRLPFLEAIEDGRVGALPGNAYAVGFVRTYATMLGLDAEEISRRFRAEAQEVNRKTELSFPAPVPQRGVPAGAVVLLGLVIAVGAYIGWYRYSGSDEARQEQGAPPVPDRLAALAPQSPQVASILPSTNPLPPAPPSAAAASSAMSAAAPVPAPAAPAPAAAPVRVPVQIAPPAPLPPAPPVSTRVVLHAKSGGWVQVRERQGQVLLNRVLRAGETWPVPMKPQLLLTTSNAGGMELLVDGVAAAPLGALGTMKRDIPLDPDVLKAARKG